VVSLYGLRPLFVPLAVGFVLACAPSAPPPAPAAPAAPAQPAAAPAAPKTLTTVRWLHGFRIQASPVTAAVVIAQDQGYYAEQGIHTDTDVVTDSSSYRLVATNQFQLTAAGPGVILDFVQQGLPLMGIAALNQEGSRSFAVRADSPIKTVKDFEGKKVGIKGGAPWTEYLCMTQTAGVDRAKVQEIGVGLSSVELKDGIVDVLPVFKNNEPNVLRKMGLDIRLIDPGANGCPTWGSTIVVNKQYATENADAVERWLKATMKGLQFYVDNKQQTLEIMARYSPKEVTAEQQEFIYDGDRPQLLTDLTRKNGLGWMTKERWEFEIEQDLRLGLIKGRVTPEDAMTMKFLEKIYKDGKLIWP
jgi:NitT/TauT family transport system substrate-binding protein